MCACMMYDTDQCYTYLNSLWIFVVGGGGGGGGAGWWWWCLSFCMVLCVGCLGGTVLYMCIEYHV